MAPTLDIACYLQAPTREVTGPEGWKEMIARIREPGFLHPIQESVYLFFLEVFPPRYQGPGYFAFAEGAEPLKLFFRSEQGCLARQLTWAETAEFCRDACIPLPE